MAPERAMIIVPHPDDGEFMAGGCTALWSAEGADVTFVIITNGNKGSDDEKMTSDKLEAVRVEEQKAAAQSLGVSRTVFLGYEDGMLEPSLNLRRDLVRVIRAHTPHTVVTFDPTTRFLSDTYPNHPDHRAAGEATIDAVFPAARDRLTFPELLEEGLAPHKVREAWMAGTSAANHWVDIESVIDRKIAALRMHKSQLSEFAVEEVIPEMAKSAAEGSPYAFAENFRRMVID